MPLERPRKGQMKETSHIEQKTQHLSADMGNVGILGNVS